MVYQVNVNNRPDGLNNDVLILIAHNTSVTDKLVDGFLYQRQLVVEFLAFLRHGVVAPCVFGSVYPVPCSNVNVKSCA